MTPRPPDLAIFVLTDADNFTPCACARGKKNIMARSILSLYGERNKKAFFEGKKRLPYLPSIEAGTLVGATADITAAT